MASSVLALAPASTSFSTIQCAEALRVISNLAKLAEKFPAESGLPLDDDRAIAEILESDWAPEWLVRLAQVRRQLQPHLEFIQFADSETLLQITSLELRSLGIEEAAQAKEFLQKFPSLNAERRLAFINGIIFRLLLETQNKLSDAENQARLGLTNPAFDSARNLVTSLKTEEIPNLTLFLMCHFAYRAEAFAEQAGAHWGRSKDYTAPLEPDYLPWVKLHGVFISPESGERLYESSDLISLLYSSISLKAERAIGFFIHTEAQHFTRQELRSLIDIPGLGAQARTTLLDWESRYTGDLIETKNEAYRQRQIRATESELAALEWATTLQDMGGTSDFMRSLHANIEDCSASLEATSCSWIYSGVQILLQWVGLGPQDLGGYALSNILSQTLMSFSNNVTGTGPLSELLAILEDGAAPFAAFAKGLSTAGNTVGTRNIEANRQELLQRLENLRHPTRTQD